MRLAIVGAEKQVVEEENKNKRGRDGIRYDNIANLRGDEPTCKPLQQFSREKSIRELQILRPDFAIRQINFSEEFLQSLSLATIHFPKKQFQFFNCSRKSKKRLMS
jgi:hypothetical protein